MIKAPTIQSTTWLNTEPDYLPNLEGGKVTILCAFQMLCPGCVFHGLPQAQRIYQTFASLGVQVLGLHTVFEHHEVMGPEALKAFVAEFGFSFPIGIDRPSNGRIPETMSAYQLQGTPSLLIIDGDGILRYHQFGRPTDLEVAAQIASCLPTNSTRTKQTSLSPGDASRIDETLECTSACLLPAD